MNLHLSAALALKNQQRRYGIATSPPLPCLQMLRLEERPTKEHIESSLTVYFLVPHPQIDEPVPTNSAGQIFGITHLP